MYNNTLPKSTMPRKEVILTPNNHGADLIKCLETLKVASNLLTETTEKIIQLTKQNQISYNNKYDDDRSYLSPARDDVAELVREAEKREVNRIGERYNKYEAERERAFLRDREREKEKERKSIERERKANERHREKEKDIFVDRDSQEIGIDQRKSTEGRIRERQTKGGTQRSLRVYKESISERKFDEIDSRRSSTNTDDSMLTTWRSRKLGRFAPYAE